LSASIRGFAGAGENRGRGGGWLAGKSAHGVATPERLGLTGLVSVEPQVSRRFYLIKREGLDDLGQGL